jgi:copper chaperone CopZ
MPLRELEIHIRGMTSSACVNLIESVLMSESGIQKVSVNLIMDRGVVLFDDETFKAEAIVAIVRELGYGVDVISEKDGCSLSICLSPFSFFSLLSSFLSLSSLSLSLFPYALSLSLFPLSLSFLFLFL